MIFTDDNSDEEVLSIERNSNVLQVQMKEKQQRENAKKEHEKKVQQDKEQREKEQLKKEKEKKRTQKREKRRMWLVNSNVYQFTSDTRVVTISFFSCIPVLACNTH